MPPKPKTAVTDEEFRLLTCADHSTDNLTICPAVLRIHCPLDNDQLRSRPLLKTNRPSSISRGEYSTHSRNRRLDLRTSGFTDVDELSVRGLELWLMGWGYKGIVQHCPDVFRALMSADMAVHFTSRHIYEALCRAKCVECGESGSHLDLFRADRYCILCMASDLWLETTILSIAEDHVAAANLPMLHSFPGRYRTRWKWFSRRQLVRPTTHNDPTCKPQYVAEFRFMTMLRIPSLTRQSESHRGAYHVKHVANRTWCITKQSGALYRLLDCWLSGALPSLYGFPLGYAV